MQLFEHQKTILDFHLDNHLSLDRSDVGVGKTPPAILYLKKQIEDYPATKALIVCPNTILENWEMEFQNWFDIKPVLLRGTRQKRTELLRSKKANVFIINYDGVRVIFDELRTFGFDVIIADEIHHIKNFRAAITKKMLTLAQTVNSRKGMTGTPILNSIEDVWSIAHFINPYVFNMNYWGFRNRYLYNKNANHPYKKFPDWQPKPGAVEEIATKIASISIRFSKKEVLKWLPPVLKTTRYVDLSPEQEAFYEDLRIKTLAELNGEVISIPKILPRINKLLQVTSGFMYRDGEGAAHYFKPNAKLDELLQILEEVRESRVLIWTAYVEDAFLLRHALHPKYKVKSISGALAASERLEVCQQFNKDEYQILVATTASASEGLTILAPYVIYFSRSWKLGERLQSLGRFDRPGSERYENITVIDLVARKTLDKKVLLALEQKQDLLTQINGDKIREILWNQ